MTDRKPKSEIRRRNHRSTIRMTEDEYVRASTFAAESGLALSAYFRLKALGESGERSRKKPRPGREALGQITAALQRLSAEHNKIGSNINQLARRANREGFDKLSVNEVNELLKAYETAVAELSSMRASVLKKMGYHDR